MLAGLDILDQNDPRPTLRYIQQFKHEIRRLRTVMPATWGVHNYADVNRLQGWRTRKVDHALGGQIWLTETGGIVRFGRAFPNRRAPDCGARKEYSNSRCDWLRANARSSTCMCTTGAAPAA